jgi:hypothetical protein
MGMSNLISKGRVCLLLIRLFVVTIGNINHKTRPCMPKYRIIYVRYADDPCHWQLQKRRWLFFWENACGNVSSATTAGHEMEKLMRLKAK